MGSLLEGKIEEGLSYTKSPDLYTADLSTYVNGIPIASRLGFLEYYDLSMKSINVGFFVRGANLTGSTGTLGEWGYVYEALKLGGFVAGAAAVGGLLSIKPYCYGCRRYRRQRRLLRADRNELSKIDDYLSSHDVRLPSVGEKIVNALGRKAVQGVALFLSKRSQGKLIKN